MTSVYGYGHNDGFHRHTGSLGQHYYQNGNNNYRQHQYHQSFSGYQSQQAYNPVPTYNQGINPQGYNPYSGYYNQPVQVPQSVQIPQPVQQQPVQADSNVTGGLLPVLDYDIKIMSKFMTYLSFRISGRSDTGNEQFILNLQNILSAVRLPLSSLILANYFLLKKYEKHSSCFQNINEDSIKEILILCLVLANKANDDNNFTNKSWQDATGLDKLLINKLEVEWLTLFQWRLHDVNMQTYNELYTQFNKYSKNINAHEEQKKWENQLQSQYNYYYQQQEAVSPPLNNCVSPTESYSNFKNNNNYFQNNWQTYDCQQNDNPVYSRYSHFKSNSLHIEPDYCTRTGSYEKLKYCSCNYCSTSNSRNVDWSYKIATAC